MNEIRLVTASVKIVTSRLCLATPDRPVDPSNPTGGRGRGSRRAAARQRADDFLMSRVCRHFPPAFSSQLDGKSPVTLLFIGHSKPSTVVYFASVYPFTIRDTGCYSEVGKVLKVLKALKVLCARRYDISGRKQILM